MEASLGIGSNEFMR